MSSGPDRLVARAQRRLAAAASGNEPGQLSSHDCRALLARIQRLRAMGDPFMDVHPSRDVACGDVAGVLDRVGGAFVTTDA